MSVFKGSKKKKAAWLFAQWSSGLDVSRDLIRDGFATGIEGLWEDEQFRKTIDPTYLEAMKISGGICDQSYVPDIVRALEAREAIEHEVTAVIEKRKDAKTALDDAANFLTSQLGPGDVLITLGAGDAYRVGEKVLREKSANNTV